MQDDFDLSQIELHHAATASKEGKQSDGTSKWRTGWRYWCVTLPSWMSFFAGIGLVLPPLISLSIYYPFLVGFLLHAWLLEERQK